MRELTLAEEREELKEQITVLKTAISLTKSMIDSCYHAEWGLSKRAIENYEISLAICEVELASLCPSCTVECKEKHCAFKGEQ